MQKQEDITDLKKEFLQYDSIDERNISFFITPLKNDASKEENIKSIKLKIFKIFSYFYGLGDKLEYEGKIIKLYKEPQEDLLPVNILVLGKTQVGKSCVINTIVNEKRAREGDRSSNETEKLIVYHVDNVPLLIYDIEGFTGEKNIKTVIDKIETMQRSFNEKELHLIIYVLQYEGNTYFNDNEYEIFKQLSKSNHESHFIFLCTRAGKNQTKAFKEIQKSFYQMIQKGLKKECKDEKSKLINTFNYLYYCQKKEINYEEIKDKVSEKEYNEMDFYQRMELKYRGMKEEDRNKEIVKTIINEKQNLIFVNLRKEIDHEKKFGMNKVTQQIINIFKNIKSNNLKILNNELNKNRLTINDINDKLTNDSYIYEEERESLMNKSFELSQLEDDYTELIESLNNQTNLKECRQVAEKLKLKIIKQANEDLTWNKIGGWLSGIIPFVDIAIQSYIKSNSQKKISKRFDDNLVDFDKKDSTLSQDEINDVEEVKEKINDKKVFLLKHLEELLL